MKRSFIVAALVLIAGFVFAQSYADGVYFAQEHDYAKSGWKNQVMLSVKSGKIIKASWNEVNNLGQTDKKSVAASGSYGMIKVSQLKKEWHEQAAVVEDYLVRTQDINFNKYTNTAGNTDAISGASIMVKEFFELAKEALATTPVSRGPYAVDGWYYASAKDFDSSGWKSNVLLTVANGSVVDAIWNGLSKDRKKKSKLIESEKGTYGMGKAAKNGEWHEQAKRVTDSLIKLQNPAAIALKADGKTDAVTGVSMTVSDFYTLSAEALKAAR